MSELVISTNQSKSATSAFASVRNWTMALSVGAALALGSLGFVTPAAAAPRPEDLKDNNAKLCAGLQEIFDDNIDMAMDSSLSNAERNAALDAATDANDDWNKYCKGRFGSIARRAPVLDSALSPQGIAPISDGGATTSPTGHSVSIGISSSLVSRLGVR